MIAFYNKNHTCITMRQGPFSHCVVYVCVLSSELYNANNRIRNHTGGSEYYPLYTVLKKCNDFVFEHIYVPITSLQCVLVV